MADIIPLPIVRRQQSQPAPMTTRLLTADQAALIDSYNAASRKDQQKLLRLSYELVNESQVRTRSRESHA